MQTNETCPKCNTSVEGGAKFCPECGTKMEPQTKPREPEYKTVFCTECGIKTTTEFAFCPECGNKMGTSNEVITESSVMSTENNATEKNIIEKNIIEKNTTEKKKYDFTKTIASWTKIPTKFIVAAGLLIVIILAGVLVIGGQGSKDKSYMIYAKDEELNFTKLSKIKSFELTDKLIESKSQDAYEYMDAGDYFDLSGYILFSEDNRYLFYPDNVSDDGASYYWRDLKKDNTKEDVAVKIDDELTGQYPVLTKDGTKFFYLKGEDNRLYVYDRKSEEKSKLDSDVVDFYVNEAGDYLIYTKYDENENVIYEMSIKGLEGKKNKIDSNANIHHINVDSKMVIYLKEGSLYQKKNDKDKVKISSDVSEVISVSHAQSIYYLKSEEVTNKLSDFINDDMLKDDSLLTEPLEPDYTMEPDYPSQSDYTEKVWNSYYFGSEWNDEFGEWGYWDETTDWDAYNEAYNRYSEEYEEWETYNNSLREEYNKLYESYQGKQNRDDLRNALSNEENAVTYSKYTLYYWNGEKESVVADDLAMGNYSYVLASSSSIPAVVYQKYSTSSTDAQKLSTLLSDYDSYFYYDDIIYDLTNKMLATRVISEDIYVASGEKESTLDSSESSKWSFDNNGNLYFYEDYDYEKSYGTLMKASISNGVIGKPVLVDEDVSNLCIGNKNKNVYYFKDVYDGSGDLYIDAIKLGTDVRMDSFYNYKGNDNLIYLTDYSTKSNMGTLCTFNNGKQVKIADDVSYFVAIDDKNIAYLTDYNEDKGRGDLSLYNGGKKPILIDTDVTAIIWNSNMLWSWSWYWLY